MVLLPTYNERENIGSIVPEIFSLFPEIFIMVIDDQSPDGTAVAVRSLQKQYPNLFLFERQKKEGLGRAYAEAFQKVLNEFPDIETVVTMDADGSHDPEDLPRLLSARSKAQVVVGSRYVHGGVIHGWEHARQLLSRWGNRYARFVTGIPVKDVTSGFNCISADVLKRLRFSTLDPSGYAFTISTKYAIWKLGAKMKEIPITFKNRRFGESKISLRIVGEGIILPWKLSLTGP